MKLSNKQKKFLKSLSHDYKAVVMIGKEGISDKLLMNANQALKAHELVKVSMLNTSPLTVNEAAVKIATNTKSEVVDTVGRVIILFKQSEEKKIDLPK